MSRSASMWNCSPHATAPSRKAWCGDRVEAASRTAPAGSSVISSSCHWITSGEKGTRAKSGSASATSRRATRRGPYSGPSAAGATSPACAVASSCAPRPIASVATRCRTALRSSDSVPGGGAAPGPLPAEQHQRLIAGQLLRQRVPGVRSHYPQPQARLGQPLPQPPDVVGGIGLDHQRSAHPSRLTTPARPPAAAPGQTGSTSKEVSVANSWRGRSDSTGQPR